VVLNIEIGLTANYVFPTFLLSLPLLVVIWFYPGQGYYSATGHFVWLVRSPGTVSHWTFFCNYIINV